MVRALISGLLMFAATMPVMAQDRLPPIPAEKQTPEQRKASEAFRANRKQDVFGPFVPLLRSPEVMLRAAFHNKSVKSSLAPDAPVAHTLHAPSGQVLPIWQVAGGQKVGDALYDQVLHPTAHRLLQHCDAVLRLPGESRGAENDVRIARERGIPVYFDISEIPDHMANLT